VPTTVYTDPNSFFKAFTHKLAAVKIDVRGAGDYVSKDDAKIWRFKEIYRCV
jgi:hypothetical protein